MPFFASQFSHSQKNPPLGFSAGLSFYFAKDSWIKHEHISEHSVSAKQKNLILLLASGMASFIPTYIKHARIIKMCLLKIGACLILVHFYACFMGWGWGLGNEFYEAMLA